MFANDRTPPLSLYLQRHLGNETAKMVETATTALKRTCRSQPGWREWTDNKFVIARAGLSLAYYL
jgi:hypothetical protein